MTISKNVYIDEFSDIVKKYNSIYHGAIKMKPVDVKLKTHIMFDKKSIYKDPKFKVSDCMRISKYLKND